MSKKKKNRHNGKKEVSPRQLAANRQNAQLSTGPQTQAGKETSSRNATTHGCYAGKVLLSWENAEDFNEYYDFMFNYFDPLNPLEVQCIDDYIWEGWRLQRLRVIEARTIQEMENDGASARELLKELSRLSLLKLRAERSREKALKLFEEHRARALAAAEGELRRPLTLREIEEACAPPQMSMAEWLERAQGYAGKNPHQQSDSNPSASDGMGSFRETSPNQPPDQTDPPGSAGQTPPSQG